MGLFQRFFKLSQPKRKTQPGFEKTFILEPILTPSGLVDIDGGDEGLDLSGVDLNAQLFDGDDGSTTAILFASGMDDADLEPLDFFDANGDPDFIENSAELNPIETLEADSDSEFISEDNPNPLNSDLNPPEDSDETDGFVLPPVGDLSDKISVFDKGIFTVGDSGEVSIDFLFDGGGYKSELAIFSLEGLEDFDFNDPEEFRTFLTEASQRALSDSEMGHVVISDPNEGPRFTRGGNPARDYEGVKTVQMNPGDRFAVMLVPKGTVEQVYDLLDAGEELPSKLHPLFSLSTANPDDGFHIGQIADVTGDGNTFALEDLRMDGKSDRDYNDIIFQVRGATGEAIDLDEAINPNRDWRGTDWGQKLVEYAAGKELPGDPIHPALPEPTIPQTPVDQGGDGFVDLKGPQDSTIEPNQGGALPNTPTLIESSATQDVIDQVSSIDPTDVYQVPNRQLVDTEILVLSGETAVSILTPEGEVLSQQVLSRGTHSLAVPEDVSGEVLLKFDSSQGSDATYMLRGFESKAAEPFNIDLEFEGELTPAQQAIIREAAKSVELLIGQGLPSAIVDGKIIDDVNFKISVNNLDGAGGTLAQTKIDFMRYGTLLPAQSITQFDVNDLAQLEQSGQLFSVVQHEILHGLGFGNLWEAKGLVDYAGTPLAQYNGENAVAAFQELGGLTDAIALETEGEGSAGLHWHKELFQDEIMTRDLGFQTGTDGQVFSPISAVTLAALADLGYRVNLDKSTPDWGLFGGRQPKPENLTAEQIEAFRQLADESFGNPDDEFIYATMPEVDPDKVAPEIWAHAERFWKNGEYYDWVRYQIKSGDTLSHLALRYLGSAGYDYYMWIANRNGIPNPDYIVTGDWIEVPVHRPNYEWEQEQERRRREEELRRRQEEEARRRREEEERLAREKAEQERKRREEEARRQEAERKRRELEEQERRLREEMERRRQEEERRKEEERLRELERQREIARQQGKGGQDWFFATPLPEFGPVDPFETKLTGETVGNLVPDDYYRFTLSRKGRITAELRKLLADADLVLYDVRNRPIAWSMREGITDEQIITDLIPGTYLLRVNSPKGVTTDYDLIVKFKHLLSRTEQGPPPGWKVGRKPGSGSGGSTGPVFADPRIRRIYDTALNNFAGPERAKANARVRDLEAEKRRYQQELEQLLNRMNAEQRAKVHGALDGARHSGNAWVDDRANGIKRSIDGTADWILGQIDSKIPSQVYSVPWFGDRLRDAKDSFKGAINGAKSWLKGKVNWVQDRVKHYIWHFIETIKNAYRTGAEINSIIENAAHKMKRDIDSVVNGINNLVGEFKRKVLDSVGWLRNVGVDIPSVGFKWNFYDSVVEPLANSFANGIQDKVNSVGNFARGAVDWVKPRTQKAVAAVVDAIFGDKTGHLYNKIHRVNEQIAATRTGLERAISAAKKHIVNIVRKIEAFLTDPEERRRVLEALWQWRFKTVEEAYNFIVNKREEVRQEIEAEKEARRKAEEEARRQAEEEARRKAEEEAWLNEKIQLNLDQEELFKSAILQGDSRLIEDYQFLKKISQADTNMLSSFSGVSLPNSDILDKKFLNQAGKIFEKFSYLQVLQNKLGAISLEKAFKAYENIKNAINSYSFNDPAFERTISTNANKIAQQNYAELDEIAAKYESRYSFNLGNTLKDAANGIIRSIGLGLHFSRIFLEIKTFAGQSLVKSAYGSLAYGSSGYGGSSVALEKKVEIGKAVYDAIPDVQKFIDALLNGDFNKASANLLHTITLAKEIEHLSKTAGMGNLVVSSEFLKMSENVEEFYHLSSLLNKLKQIEGKYINSDDIDFVYWSHKYSAVSTLVSIVKSLSALVSHLSNGFSNTQIADLKTDKMTKYLDSANAMLESTKGAIWAMFEEWNAKEIRNHNAIFSYIAEYNHSAIKTGQKIVSYLAKATSSKLQSLK